MAAQEAAAGGGIPQQVVTRWRYGDVGDSNFAVHGRAVPLLVGLLCAIVVFVTLCLYLRWRCHRYAPADDPEVVVSVVVQRPTNGFYGGQVAGPLFQDVMAFALAQRGGVPSGEPARLYPQTW